jgi:hypothetical protein
VSVGIDSAGSGFACRVQPDAVCDCPRNVGVLEGLGLSVKCVSIIDDSRHVDIYRCL